MSITFSGSSFSPVGNSVFLTSGIHTMAVNISSYIDKYAIFGTSN